MQVKQQQQQHLTSKQQHQQQQWRVKCEISSNSVHFAFERVCVGGREEGRDTETELSN
jgi:invasion protein IalB